MSYKYKSLLLIENKEIKEPENYLNIINEDLAFIIFTYIDEKLDINNLFVFDPFMTILKNPYNWMNKLKINFTSLNWRFLNFKNEFTSYPSINIDIYNKFRINIILTNHRFHDCPIKKLDDPDFVKYLQTAKATDEYSRLYKMYKDRFINNTLLVKNNEIYLELNNSAQIEIINNASKNDVFNIILKTLYSFN